MLQQFELPKDEKELDEDVTSTTEEAIEEDGTPVLDEEDLEENDLSEEEADQIIWDEPKTGSAGKEEKDITD